MLPLNVPWSRSSDKTIACRIANTVAVIAQLYVSPRLAAGKSASFRGSFQRSGMLMMCTPFSVCMLTTCFGHGLQPDVHTVRDIFATSSPLRISDRQATITVDYIIGRSQ